MKRRLWYLLLSMMLLVGVLGGCAQIDGDTVASVAQELLSTTADTAATEAQTKGDVIELPIVPVEDTTKPVETEEQTEEQTEAPTTEVVTEAAVSEDGQYTSKEDVALYIHLYGHLPSNYISKNDAQDLGWPGGDLWAYADGMSIGGSYFGNYEKLLPEADGRSYYECDIDYQGGKRNAKRIVYSNDGLIYYTEDHYESFELLYGEE